MTEWIKHNSTEPPALAPAALVEVIDNYGDDFGPDRVNSFRWKHISHYCSLTDPEGVPYCSAEGLEPWAEYVATENDGRARQYEQRPSLLGGVYSCMWSMNCHPIGVVARAPDTHRHPGDWKDSLMRVWRD